MTTIRSWNRVNISKSLVATQQTFVLMKTSWRRLSSLSSEDVLIKTNMFALALRLQKTSWSRPIYSSWPYVFKTFSRRLQDVLPRRLQDVFKTSSNVLPRRLQRVFKTSWRRLQNVFKTSSRCLQDVFKTYWRRLQEVFKTSSRRLAKSSSRRFQGVSSS